MTKQQVSEAWSFQTDWCKNNMPSEEQGKSIGDVNVDAGDLGGCPEGSSLSHSYYAPYGVQNMTLTNLKIDELKGTSIDDPQFLTMDTIDTGRSQQDGSQQEQNSRVGIVISGDDSPQSSADGVVIFPVKFDHLKIKGHFVYTEYCQCYSQEGFKMGKGSAYVTESDFVNSYENGYIFYHATVAGEALTIIRATISGDAQIAIVNNNKQSTFDKMLDFLYSLSADKSAIRTNIAQSFAAQSFDKIKKRMIDHIKNGAN